MTAERLASVGRRWRALLGRLAWAGVALLALGLVVAEFPYRFDQLRTYCLSLCEAGRLPPTEAPALQSLGLTLQAYAVYTMALYLALTLGCWVIAALIMWRRSGEHMAVLASVMLVALSPSSGLTLTTVVPAWRPVFVVLILAGFVSIVYLFYLFPDGHFVPRWTRWAFLPWTLWLGLGIGLTALRQPMPRAFWPVQIGLTLALFVAGGLAQVYRYARVSNPTQRQQTKWVVVGFALIIAFETADTLYLDFVRPALGQPVPSGVIYEAVSSALGFLTLIIIPLTLGIAILRYRLWDIDVIIRRTLVYAVLSGFLTLAYFGSVLALQTAFGALTGQRQSALVTVLSTLVIAALFVPVRGRVQAAIDQRFYRRHYDAARTLAAFGVTLREHVELDGLMERLLEVVDETMEPASATLWIKPVDQIAEDVGSFPSPVTRRTS